MNVLLNCFQDHNLLSDDGSLVGYGSPFFGCSDIHRPFVWQNQMTSVCNTFYNKNIKRFNLRFTYLHHDIILKIVTKSTSKGEGRKTMTSKNLAIKIWINAQSQTNHVYMRIFIMEIPVQGF